MKSEKIGIKSMNIDQAEAHRVRSISIFLNHNEDLLCQLFRDNLQLCVRYDSDNIAYKFNILNPEDIIMARSALDFYNSTDDSPFWQCLWDLNSPVLIRLIRAICHQRYIQLETIQGIMHDYLGGIS